VGRGNEGTAKKNIRCTNRTELVRRSFEGIIACYLRERYWSLIYQSHMWDVLKFQHFSSFTTMRSWVVLDSSCHERLALLEKMTILSPDTELSY
jgi:hypothetical protein